MATPRLDLDRLADYSAAQRDLDQAAPLLTDHIAAVTLQEARSIEQMTRVHIIDFAAARGYNLPTGTKADLVAAYAEALAGETEQAKQLADLTFASRMDRSAAEHLNRSLDGAEQIQADFAAAVVKGETANRVRSDLANMTEQVMAAQCDALLAASVIDLVGQGAELREAVTQVAARAMFTVMNFPSDIRHNGTGGTQRLSSMLEAEAAARFMQYTAARVLGDTVPAEWITR